MLLRRVCVFCGSSPGASAVYATAVEALGAAIVARGAGLVYGGAAVGLMGRLADAALGRGGEVDGVIPRALVEKEVAHRGLTRLHVVESMHARKATMASLSDAFVAAPGGLGTMEELFEVLTWAQLGMHGKPCGLLDVDGYFGPLLRFLDAAVERGFVRPEHRAMVLVRTEPEALLRMLADYAPPRVGKWISRGET